MKNKTLYRECLYATKSYSNIIPKLISEIEELEDLFDEKNKLIDHMQKQLDRLNEEIRDLNLMIELSEE